MDSTCLEKIKGLLLEIEQNAIYSSKSHFRAGEVWGNVHISLGLTMAILSGTITFILRYPNLALLTGVFSGIVTILAAIITFLNPSDKNIRHKNTGNDYLILVGKARMLRECKVDCNSDSALILLENLQDEKAKLDRQSPLPPGWAYRYARFAVEKDGQTVHNT
jgi:hypothetical protein